MAKVRIERVPLIAPDEDKIYVNSNNHAQTAPWADKDAKEARKLYHDANDEYHFTCYATPELYEKLLSPPILVRKIKSKYELSTLKEAGILANYSGESGLRKNDDLNDIIEEVQKELDATKVPPPYFCRLNACSAKDADGGKPVPFNNAKEAIFKICLAERCSSRIGQLLQRHEDGFSHFSEECFIFTRWETKVDMAKEWRCIIKDGIVTAISQYSCYKDVGAQNIGDEKLKRLGAEISEFWKTQIMPLVPCKSCVLDVFATENTPSTESENMWDLKMLELNPFGSHLGSGSALFHWIRDRSAMYGEAGDEIVLRIVDPALGKFSVVDKELVAL